MKIAVLFGSFNPLTNAHLAAMKAAVAALQADKGLFVATNGKYLRWKNVKTGDPFYLTEEERRAVIEQVCATEDNLDFGGFELGGISPSRYKTLCRIQRIYPDAQIIEIMGADKVHTMAKSKNTPNHLTQFQVAVFRRGDIDLDKLFADTPVLPQYKSSFHFLPALEESGDISSTQVRQRFYAGQDYSDLLPAPSAAVVGQHRPEDFSMSFAERMELTIASSQFGLKKAATQVYQENAKLFKQWQDGTLELDFGDRQAYLDNTKLYTAAYSVADLGTVYPTTETGCVNADCVDIAQQLVADGYNPAILNLASARSPGGGYHQGYAAQEESLCHSSNLSQSLYQFGDPQYKHIRQSGVPHKADGYPLDINYGGIYTPNVTFFRHGRQKFFDLREQPFRCDVITVAALSFRIKSNFSDMAELIYRASGGGFTPDGTAIMLNKIRTIFRMGVEHGKDALVLGAFGCGAYKLPVPDVVRLFRQVMNEPEFAGKFRLLVFAILEGSRSEGKFTDFYREFGTYNNQAQG